MVYFLRFRFCGFLCLVFMLGACASGGHDGGVSSSGGVAGQSGEDPMEAHMEARKAVDPNGRKDNPMVKQAVDAERNIRAIKSEFKGLKDIARQAEATTAGRLAALPVAAGGGDARVKALRIGEHVGKTRLVFDVAGEASYSYEVDNAQKVLLVSMAAAGFDASKQKVFSDSQMLKAYVAKLSDNRRVLVAFKLTGSAQVLKSSDLGAGVKGLNRIFIDVAPL